MISVEEALEIVLNNCPSAATELVPFDQCQGRILAEDILADRDFPPFDRITMDGIAIKYKSYSSGQRAFPISGIAPAGSPIQKLENKTHCIEAMTGAILPEHTDTIIKYEDLEIAENIATVKTDAVKFRQNVHFQGVDRKQGSVLLSEGIRILAPEIGVLSTAGKSEVSVFKSPRIAVISSGNELVNVNETPLAHQIRKSNNFSIESALKKYSNKIQLFHLPDDKEVIEASIRSILPRVDVIILSGGVSKGKFDFIPDALEQNGVTKLFHRVMQRPGKPFWFGLNKTKKVVFALPGNPVSSFMCTMKYVSTWMEKHLNIPEVKYSAVLASDIHFKPDLNYYAQVKLVLNENAEMFAYPIEGNGSGDLANLTDADAFMELGRGKNEYKAGEIYPIYPFRN